MAKSVKVIEGVLLILRSQYVIALITYTLARSTLKIITF